MITTNKLAEVYQESEKIRRDYGAWKQYLDGIIQRAETEGISGIGGKYILQKLREMRDGMKESGT